MYIDLKGYFGKLHSSDQQIIRAVLAPYTDLGPDFVEFIMNFSSAVLDRCSRSYIDRLSDIVFSQKESSFISNAKYIKDEDLIGRDEFLMQDPDVQRLHDKFRYLRVSLQDFQDLRQKLESELDVLFSIENMKNYVKDSQRLNLMRNYLKSVTSNDYEDFEIRLLFMKNMKSIPDVDFDFSRITFSDIKDINNKDLFSKMDLKLLQFEKYFNITSLS